MKFLSWISFRFLFSGNTIKLFSGRNAISLIGLILGVACLVVSLSVISGFEKTLKFSVAEVSGHLQVRKVHGEFDSSESMLEQIKNKAPEVLSGVSFLTSEGILTKQGQLQGVLLHGVDDSKVKETLNLHGRLLSGDFELSTSEVPTVLIGQALAKKFNLKKGDTFKIVVPLSNEIDPNQFRRQVGEFTVAGVLNMGKYEYDERLIFMNIIALQNLLGSPNRFTGLFLKLNDIDAARDVGNKLLNEMGPAIRVWDWRDVNENLFEAIEVERVVLFFVIGIIIIAAAFNVASSLYVGVVRRYSDIAVLKAVGFSKTKIRGIFILQGFFLGVVGLILGLLLGFVLGLAFFWSQTYLGLIPADVYKLGEIDLFLRPQDLLWIVVMTLLVCFLATFAPSRQGSELSAVEGLRHE